MWAVQGTLGDPQSYSASLGGTPRPPPLNPHGFCPRNVGVSQCGGVPVCGCPGAGAAAPVGLGCVIQTGVSVFPSLSRSRRGREAVPIVPGQLAY